MTVDTAASRGPLLTSTVNEQLRAARQRGDSVVTCTLDLGRSTSQVEIGADAWKWHGQEYPYLQRCRERTVYRWNGDGFEPVARFGKSLLKLVPTDWGPPTFEIDGVKMLPTKTVSPYEDARLKVGLIAARGKRVLDTCAGLGYFAAWCVAGGADHVLSFELDPDVLWLRGINPWSPPSTPPLELRQADVAAAVRDLAPASFDAILHDPPRFGLAGELYSQAFYDELARVLQPGGRLFHYTGTPNRLTTGRDVPREVAQRLRQAGFSAERCGDGILAVRGRRSSVAVVQAAP
jgi:predicted methyltransferase